MSELERWFPVLRPQSGGALRLQEAIADLPHGVGGLWPGYAWAALAMLVIAVSPLYITNSPQRVDAEVAVAMDELASRPVRVVSVADGDAVEMLRSDPSVRVFLVMTR
jgi:hypothetical protein